VSWTDNSPAAMPRWVRELVDGVVKLDAARFEANPNLEGFARPAVEGEFWPLKNDEVFTVPGARRVWVEQVEPGFRTRRPYVVVSATNH